VAETGKNTGLAAALLLKGKLVAIPTETVYGLAANALDEKAVLSIFEAKQRPFFDPLIIHVHSLDAAKNYADFADERLILLAETFWPGPLTLLLPKKKNIPGIVTSGLDQVAVRVPKHELTLELLKKINIPLAAPSANPFGYVSPTEPQHVNKQLGEKVDYILDGGPCEVGLESTILGIEDEKICVFRLGGLTIESIEKIIGKVELRINNSSDPKAPGQLKNHYAPKKPLFIGSIEELVKKNSSKKIALIYFGEEKYSGNGATLFNLSKTKNFEEAAINLFNFLRLADDSLAEVVLCELLPDVGLGRAINDRLRRASTL
jgi:L-threonylcarbamoyladenylate synthase